MFYLIIITGNWQKKQGQEVSYIDRYEIAHFSKKKKTMVNEHAKKILVSL